MMPHRSILLALALGLATEACWAGPASDAVRRFYQPEVGFEPDLALRDHFVDPAKSIFEKNDRLSNNGDEIGCIDFVLAIDAQDLDQDEIDRTLKLTEKATGDTAVVTATFRLFPGEEGYPREIVWDLRQVDGAWKVADIASITNDWRLSEFSCE